MKQVKLGSIDNGGLFHFLDDPKSRTYRVVVNRPDNIVWYNVVSRPEDDFWTTLFNKQHDWLTHDVDVYIEN